MAIYALARDGFYLNVIIADEDFVEALVDSGEIDFATAIDEGGTRPSPGDPTPIYYVPSNEGDWPSEPVDLRDATNILAKRPSFAADKNDGNDQIISGTEWQVVTAERTLWDSGIFDLESSEIRPSKDGIYNFDTQFRVGNLNNVSAIELALFKNDGPESDYWFTLSKTYDLEGLSEIHTGNMTQFDFYADERYQIKVLLTPADEMAECSATILGSDDFTAWGSSWSTPINNGYRSIEVG